MAEGKDKPGKTEQDKPVKLKMTGAYCGRFDMARDDGSGNLTFSQVLNGGNPTNVWTVSGETDGKVYIY